MILFHVSPQIVRVARQISVGTQHMSWIGSRIVKPVLRWVFDYLCIIGETGFSANWLLLCFEQHYHDALLSLNVSATLPRV
jgi:hypothetical protein